MINILLIEDSKLEVKIIKKLLTSSPENTNTYSIINTNTLAEGIKLAKKQQFNIVLLDLGLPDSMGIDTLIRFKNEITDIPVVILTGCEDHQLAIESLSRGAVDYIVKGNITPKLFELSIKLAITRQDIQQITKLASQEIQNSEYQLKTIIEKNVNGILIVDKLKNICYCNPGTEIIFTKKRDDLLDTKFMFPVKPDSVMEIEIDSSPGIKKYCLMHSVMIEWQNKPAYLITLNDITHQKKIEQDIRKRLAYEAMLAKISSEAVISDNISTFQDKCLQIMGKTLDVSRIYVFQFNPEKQTVSNTFEWAAKNIQPQKNNLQDLPIKIIPWWHKKLTNNETINFSDINDIPSKQEKKILQEQHIQSILVVPLFIRTMYSGFMGFDECRYKRTWQDEDINILITISQILCGLIDKKQEEQETQKFKTIIEQADYGALITDLKHNILYVNSALALMLGYEIKELIGRNCKQLHTHKQLERMNELGKLLMENGSYTAQEIDYKRKDNSTFSSLMNVKIINDKAGEPVYIASTITDITERINMEKNMFKIQKLESIETLAGGIAHDFNNMLSSILGNLSIIKMDSTPGDDAFESIIEMEKSALEAKNLVKQMFTFAKEGSFHIKKSSIKSLLEETTEFVLRGARIKAQYNITDNLWPVEIDEEKIIQVIENIIFNARQSMKQSGIIKISAENEQIQENNELLLLPGNYIKLTISDQGIGIKNADLLKIFDPYFTTKKNASGLGLSIAYSIIKKHNGTITVDSKINKGTTMIIYLPAAVVAVKEEKKSSPSLNKKEIHKQKHILVMDDDLMLQKSIKRILERLGYAVSFASNSQMALDSYKKFKKTNNPFDLVIIDLTIQGGPGGEETIRKLKEIDPRVKALVSSGYPNNPVMINPQQYGFLDVIPKPYTIQEMEHILQKILS